MLVTPNPGAHTVVPPLGLGYMSSVLRRGGHDVAILDLARERCSHEEGARRAARQKPDIVGISVLSTAFREARSFIESFRSLDGAVPVVAGGPHITALPQAIAAIGADFGIQGEGEQSFSMLVERLDQNAALEGLPGVIRRNGSEVAAAARAEGEQNLDSLEFPAWDLMPPASYPDMPHQLLHKRFPVAPVITSRGCPYQCSFCASTTLWGKRLRTRSPENVVDEIEMLVNDFGVREIHFEDDNFTQKRSHARQVCEGILNRGIDIAWMCPNGVRIDSLDDDLLALMKASGCHSLGLGLESGSQEVLDLNHKKLDLNEVPERVQMIKSHGISAHGFFIIGLPGETRRTIRQTLEFSRRLPLDQANFTLLAPLPGTPIYEKYVEKPSAEGRLDPESLNFFTPFPIGEMDSGELKKWQRRAVYGFYLRPRQLRHVLGLLRPSQAGRLLRALVDYSH